MANYSVFGYIKTPDNKIVSNAKVYPYFKKVSTVAPESKWTSIPYTSDSKGYYTFDLGDKQLIGTESNIVKGTDKIYLAIVWNENNLSDQDRNSLTFSHCLFIEHTTINDDFFEINLTMEPKRLPIVDSLTFSSNNLLTKTNYTISEKSRADYSWKTLPPYNNQISQKLNFDLVPIFDGHQMINTIYDWGESVFNVANSSSKTYQYTRAGIYNTCVTVREKWNTEVKTCQEVTVKYNKPIVDFNWSPTLTNSWEGNKIKGTELITFNNLSSDIDNRTKDSSFWGDETYHYEWTITDKNLDGSDNTKIYTGDFYLKPKHQFQSPGTKDITLKVFWNDGFQDIVETITKQIIIEPFNIVPNFSWNKIPKNRNDNIVFTDTSTGDISKIVKYNWIIEDNYPKNDVDLYTFLNTESSIFNEGTEDNTKIIDNTYNIETIIKNTTVKFHSSETKNIKLTITYFNGWEDVTKEISKDLIPEKYFVSPLISVSNYYPLGRHEKVSITNISNYLSTDGFNLAYTVDWKISDFYSSENLDNPNKGTITDNTKEYLDYEYNKIVEHYYQNNMNNIINLTIRYDDGYQMQTKRTSVTVTPIVYKNIVPDFIFNIPSSRFDKVTIENKTKDINNRFRKMEYLITDSYNKYNPDNSDYGNSVKDNSKYFELFVNNNITHYFQDSKTEYIELIYYYDDGFEEKFVDLTKNINKNILTIVPNFDSDVTPINNGFLGKNPITFFNITDSVQNVKFEDEKWTFNDRELLTEIDNITIRNDQIPFENQVYTFQTPSRFPFSSEEFKVLNLPKEQNLNKTVSLEIRIDNGWRNDTELENFYDPNNENLSEMGGQVYYLVEKLYEASPNEIESDILFETNIDNYTH